MEITASLKYARVGAQKARLVTDLVRGKPVSSAMSVLRMSQQKSAGLVLAVLEQAVASAEEKKVMDLDNLYVKTIYINAGPHLRRFRPGSERPFRLTQQKTEPYLCGFGGEVKMGQKIHPNGLRIGIVKSWNSRWYAKGQKYANNIYEDHQLRLYIKKKA